MTLLPRPVVLLGLAGVLPQLAAVVAILLLPDTRYFALAVGCCYAALILSFLGGMWWMTGLLNGRDDPVYYAIAVAPSLIGWAALLPWCFGWPWPQASLLWLGLCLLLSPLVDWRLAPGSALPPAWLRLRVVMAAGIGVSTLALAILSA